MLVKEHLPLGRRGGHHPDRRRHPPEVVEEDRHRLPDRGQRVVDVQEVPGDVGEVLRVQAEVGVEVGDQGPRRIEPQPVAMLAQHRTAVGHRGRLADHDPGKQRVLDVDEGAESVPELGLQAADVVAAGDVGGPGDDGADLELVRVALVGERLHGGAEHLVALGVGGDERAVGDVVGAGPARRRLHPLALRPPVPRLDPAEPLQGAPHPVDGDRGAQEPVGVEQHRSQTDDPEVGGIVEADGEGDDKGDEQHRPGQRARGDLEGALLGAGGECRPGANRHRARF